MTGPVSYTRLDVYKRQLYGLRDSVTRRLLGGVWDGLTQQDLQMYEEAYLSNDADRESPYYCLFNNDLTREVPPCLDVYKRQA